MIGRSPIIISRREINDLNLKSSRKIDEIFKLDSQSIQDSIKPMNYKKDSLFNKDLFKIHELQSEKKSLEEREDLWEKPIQDKIKLLKKHLEHKPTSTAIKQLDLFCEIKSNFTWGHYVYKSIFANIFQLKKDGLVSLKDLLNILDNLQEKFEKKRVEQKFITLEIDGGITEKNISLETRFSSSNKKVIAKRQEIFLSIGKLLIQDMKYLQFTEFKKNLATSVITTILTLLNEQHEDLLIISHFVSMLSYFCALRDFPFIVDCLEGVFYQTYYTTMVTTEFCYASDSLSGEKAEKKRKRMLKYGISGDKIDSAKSFIAAPANFIQSLDATLLRKVVAKFLKKFPERGLWVRHNCFVVPPECVPYLQQSFKEAFIDTFFTNSQIFKDTEIEERICLSKDSPIYIFQVLLLSNLFNLLEYSLNGFFPDLTNQ